MNLKYNWKEIATRAWSIRFIVAAAVLSGLEVLFALINPDAYGIPQGTFAGLSAVASGAAFAARLIAQRNVSG